MRKALFLSICLALILSGCLSISEEIPLKATDVPAGLPATWTPVPTDFPRGMPTKTNTPQISPSPTPTDPPPTEPLPTEDPIQPSTTSIPRSTPAALVPGMKLTITTIKMESFKSGWAIGHIGDGINRILKTRSSGNGWWDRTPEIDLANVDYFTEEDTTAYFWDLNRAWVLFNHDLTWENETIHKVYLTTDGGETWKASNPLPFPLDTIFVAPAHFYFLNPLQGWLWVHGQYMMMHDYSYLFSTSDGGLNWTLVNRPGDSMIEAMWNTEMAFADEDYGWMLKDSLGGFIPMIEITEDGGVTWERVDLLAPEGDWEVLDRRCMGMDPYFKVGSREGTFLLNCAPAKEGAGYDLENMTSYLYSSSDSGMTWEIQELPAQVDQLVLREDYMGFAFGKEHFITLDGGATWQKVKEVNWSGKFSVLTDDLLWAVARSGEEIALVYSEDGGQTYRLLNPSVGAGE